MTSEEALEHFSNMGVLDKVIYVDNAYAKLIIASAREAYASRCMKDFLDSPYFWASPYGIYAVTTDGVPVTMAFTNQGEDDVQKRVDLGR